MNNYRRFLESQGYNVSPQWPVLENRVECRIFEKGSLIVDDTKPSFCIYLLDIGCVRFFTEIDDVEFTNEFIEAPNAFGTHLGFDPQEYNLVNIQALTDVEIYVLEPEGLEIMINKYPGFKEIGDQTVGQLLKKRNAYAKMLAHNTPEERYKHFMNTQASLLQIVPQHMIASYLGITPESLSRIRKRMFSRPDKLK